MKNNIRQSLNTDKCNAYSGTAYLYAAISVNDRPVNEANTDNKEGGIIVFPQDANVMPSDIESTIRKYSPKGWTIGRFLKGRYTGKTGKVYSEESLSIEITGISEDTLTAISEELCKAFDLSPVLIKSYAERNRIFVVE